jgi:membrane protein implicated in regulation of membrane protease activity
MKARLLAFLVLVFGVACFIVGAALSWGDRPLLGYSIGAVGTVAFVVGAIMARQAMVGRFIEAEDEELLQAERRS